MRFFFDGISSDKNNSPKLSVKKKNNTGIQDHLFLCTLEPSKTGEKPELISQGGTRLTTHKEATPYGRGDLGTECAVFEMSAVCANGKARVT